LNLKKGSKFKGVNMKIKVLLVLFLCVSSAFLFSMGAEETSEIKIGVAGAHTGDLAPYGIPTVHACELYIEKINEAGGIDGKQVVLIIEDDQCAPEIATNTATKLVGDEVVAVIGHICSGATKSALGVYLEADVPIPCISPSATNPPLTQSGDYPNFFRTIAPDDAQAKFQVEFALGTLGFKKIAVLHDKGDYGKGLAEFAQGFIEADGRAEVVLFEGVTAGAVDYTAVINKIVEAGADGVIFGGYHPEASKLVTQMKDRGLDIPFLSGDGVKGDAFIELAGENAEGVYATYPTMDIENNPIALEAKQNHIDKYGDEPGAFFYNAYAAIMALVNAIDKAGSTDYNAITDALRSEYVDTPIGSISFDSKGDAIGVGFAVFQVQNGEYVELK
jgi:branched-chain amino acid transport system substrate-binding protein